MLPGNCPVTMADRWPSFRTDRYFAPGTRPRAKPHPMREFEAAPDARIFCSRLAKGSRSWTQPEVVVRPQAPVQGCWFGNKSVGDTVLFLDREQCLWLFFAGVTIGGWSGSHVDFVVSHDLGRHWSPVQRLIGGLGQSPRCKLIELAGGQVMIPLSSWLFRWQGYTVCLNLSNGQVISKSIPAKIPGPENSQPSLVTLPNHEVVAYLRNPRVGPLLFSKWNSALNQWSPARPVNLPSPNSAVDAIPCENGVLVVYTADLSRRFFSTLELRRWRGCQCFLSDRDPSQRRRLSPDLHLRQP